MDDRDIFILKKILTVLRGIGGVGLRKDDLLDHAEIAAGLPLTTEQRERCFQELRDRKYINSHFEPVIRQERWSLTERGMTALESL